MDSMGEEYRSSEMLDISLSEWGIWQRQNLCKRNERSEMYYSMKDTSNREMNLMEVVTINTTETSKAIRGLLASQTINI